jgi:hypothetical protein
MRLGVRAFFKYLGDARLADARLARDQDDLPVARLGARPPAQQQVDLVVTANQQFEPRVDRLLGVVFVRRGIAEKDEDGIPETAGYKPATGHRSSDA